jgi:hypothetical protein
MALQTHFLPLQPITCTILNQALYTQKNEKNYKLQFKWYPFRHE